MGSILRNGFLRIIFFTFVLVALFAAAVFVQKYFYKPICKDCNVILISLDTLGSGHLPCYGYLRDTAPNLCKFAKDNVMFKNSFSSAPWTLPSHFSIFTSLYPSHHGIYEVGVELNSNIRTLPEILKENGYETIFVGPSGDPQLPLDKGLGRGIDQIIGYRGLRDTMGQWQKGLDLFSKNAAEGKKSFLFLHTYWVHAPYVVGEMTDDNKRMFTDQKIPQIPLKYTDYENFSSSEYREYIDYLINGKVSDNIKAKLVSNPHLGELKNSLDTLPAEIRMPYATYNFYIEMMKEHDKDGEYTKALYDETIYYLDKQLAPLLDSLKGNLGKNTILIITADHGEEFLEHGNFTHPVDDLYNSVTGVPLIMYVPGQRSREVADMVEGVDIFPTILGMTGVSFGGKIDGLDLSGLIANRAYARKKSYLISQGLNADSIRNEEWKLYMKGPQGQNKELFNQISDPSEKSDVSSSQGGVMTELKNLFSGIVNSN